MRKYRARQSIMGDGMSSEFERFVEERSWSRLK
jgi:hypothetical protein